MTRRSEERRRKRVDRSPVFAASVRRSRTHLRIYLGAILVVVLGAALWVRSTSRKQAAPLLLTPMDAAGDFAKGQELLKQGRSLESLLYLREASLEVPDQWVAHHDYAAALLNGVHEQRTRYGFTNFRVRSSAERVAMVREAWAELEAAERLAANRPGDVALVRRTRAQSMKAWGFPWEAFAAYREAEWMDSSKVSYADALMDLMRAPAARHVFADTIVRAAP